MPKRSAKDKALPAYDLRADREAKDLSQVETAAILCCGQASVARWERDGSLPLIYRKYWQLYWLHQPKKKGKPKLTVVKGVTANATSN